MLTHAKLAALSDNEFAIYLNGGYGAEKRKLALLLVRQALEMADEPNSSRRYQPEGPTAA